MLRVSKEVPLAELTLRRYEKPYALKDRALVKKLCLSLGLLQPGDSRDVVVDVFYALLKSKVPLTAKEVENSAIVSRKEHFLPLFGIASSNVRRQLKRLKSLFFVERVANSYRICENASLHQIFEERIEQFHLKLITERVKEYLKKLDEDLKK
ncbi:hypothetical protein HY484_00350 [Candidatus Woesearchaeota archaeon]|nr:hypothetical protein [Candidatus Woesearchaeota archaeon]